MQLSKTLWAAIVAAVVLLVAPTSALASHFRYGNITWRIPDPVNAPRTVEFTVTHGWRSTATDFTILNFGDGATNGINQGTAIGSGIDANGEGYTIFEYQATHTYSSPGAYKAYFGSCCRVGTLQNAGDDDFRVEADVFIEADGSNTGGPISGIPVIIQMEVGGVRQFVLPVFDPDDDPFTCSFSTQAESGIAGNNPPQLPGGQGGDALSFVSPGCTIEWDLTNAVAGVKYATSIEVTSASDNGNSKATIDYIIELVPPGTVPTCAGGGNFSAGVGSLFTHIMQFSDPNNNPLTLSVNGAPAGSVTTPPGGSTLTPTFPKPVTFTWTPTSADAGTTRLIQFTAKDSTNFSGFCTVIVTVPECPGFGEPCCEGTGACQNCGTVVCIGANPVCSANPGTPGNETCNSVDDDCDGTTDNNLTDTGLACSSGQPGVCDAGTTSCNAGTLSCDPTIQPGTQTETCNGLDDDCDGQDDEDFNLGTSCTEGLGICQASGQIVCDGLGGATCDATPGTPQTEICGSQFDEDCDGQLNTGCVDSDGDGIIDDVEIAIGTDPLDADTDDDGVPDGQEPGGCVDYPECFTDADGDGLIQPLDPDSDNDGLLDGTEMGFDCTGGGTDVSAGNCVPDGDAGATTTDPLDPDTDDGGVTDGSEDLNLNGVVDAGETDPTAGNGADDLNATNVDSDGDGLSDNFEIAIGTDPNDADTDDDGVLDGQEPNPTLDSDGDGLINPLDVDSDNDGLYDGTEMGFDCSDPDTAPGHCIADGDAGATTTSPLLKDTDGGGVMDGSEDSNLNGVIDAGETDPTAGHGADDMDAANDDNDGDGLSDDLETTLGSDPNDADSDDDGVLDGQEPNPADDADGDGLINLLDVDSDDDGLYDGTEMGFDCSAGDTDPGPPAHCIADGDNGATTTNPLLKDTDGGGVSDGSEDANLNGVVDGGETDPTDGNGADDTDPANTDSDGDGLSDALETFLGSDPNDMDSDDDGLLDGDEHNPADHNDGDSFINLLDVDSDDDGLYDGTEAGKDCSNADTTPGHCIADGDAGATTTSPLLWDTDGGGAGDGSEDPNLDGVIDGGEQDPNDPSDDGNVTDSDGDGLGDALETAIGTDPNDVDSDDDGLPDGSENNPADDADGDSNANAADPDADGDGIFDGTENGLDCSNADTDPAAMNCIPDGDDGATTTNHLDPDTDGGGKADGDEDKDFDGVIDNDETDPNDPSDDGQECVVDADCGGPMSGIVCHDTSKTCVPGCRGLNGNGCPTGEECTSMDETIGECIPIGGEGGGGMGPGVGGSGPGGPGAGGSTQGAGGADLNLNGPIEARGGCACEAPAGRGASGPWALVLAGLGMAALRRRRRAA